MYNLIQFLFPLLYLPVCSRFGKRCIWLYEQLHRLSITCNTGNVMWGKAETAVGTWWYLYYNKVKSWSAKCFNSDIIKSHSLHLKYKPLYVCKAELKPHCFNRFHQWNIFIHYLMKKCCFFFIYKCFAFVNFLGLKLKIFFIISTLFITRRWKFTTILISIMERQKRSRS